MQSATRRIGILTSASDAELQWEAAGDRDGTTMDDTHDEDLGRPTIHDDGNMLEDRAATGSSPKSPAKKKVASLATAKTNGMSPNPTVKKGLNYGTSGSGTAKLTGSKGPAGFSAPTLKKSTTSPPPVASKLTLVSSTSSKPTTAALPTRRMSVVPAKISAPGLAKQSLSASASMKPSEDPLRASPTGSVGSARSPIVMAAPGRPRASVSEAMKKAPTSLRPSIAGSAKSAGSSKATSVTRSSAAPITKPSRPAGSISSIKEVKEGGTKVIMREDKINELKGQLEEANKSLDSKAAVVIDLERRVIQLEESLVSVNAELDCKTSSASNLEEAKIATDSLLSTARETLDQAQEELREVNSVLESVTKELSVAKINALTQDEVIQSLQTQKNDLEAAIASYKEKITHLEADHAKAVVDLTEAASVAREDYVKAHAKLRSHIEEIEAQRVSQGEVAKELEARSAKLKEMTDIIDGLQAHLTALLAEKEENANKVSELEVEILELKENQEGLEDNRDALQTQVDELLRKLANADATAGIAAETAAKRDAEWSDKLKELSMKHEQELESSAARVAEITTSLDHLRAEYDEIVGGLQKAKMDAIIKEEQHNLKMVEAEKAHADALAALSTQLEEVSRDLNEQESMYNQKLNRVNAEHAKLLEQAFERAKIEATHVHSLELQELRSDSNSAIQQIQEANRNSLEELKAEHASKLENEAGRLNKNINQLKLELKATQDDLVKAKASLEASRSEIESLAQQRDDARAQANAVPVIDPEQAAEISRFAKELESTKDDLAQITNALALTKSSMAELSEKHAKELEAAAKGRADEVVQLRAAHDAEVSELATYKAELLIKLSDLEGELATATAAVAAHEAASQKVNGVSHPPSPGVPREELQKLHEAHNLKIHDMQAEHDKALKSAEEEIQAALKKINDLQQDIERKEMEIQFLGQEQEESQEHIARLKSDLETLSEKSPLA